MSDSYITRKKKQIIENLRKEYKEKAVKTGKELGKILMDYQILELFLEASELKISNKNSDKANKLFHSAWIRVKERISYFHLFSEIEMLKYLQEKNKKRVIVKTYYRLKSLIPLTKILKKYVSLSNPIIDIAGNLNIIYSERISQLVIDSKKSKDYLDIQREMGNAIRQFSACIRIAETLNELSIPGIKEYVDYILSAYKEVEKIFVIVRKYADNIHSHAEDAQKSWISAVNASSPSARDGANIMKAENKTVDELLDSLFKRR